MCYAWHLHFGEIDSAFLVFPVSKSISENYYSLLLKCGFRINVIIIVWRNTCTQYIIANNWLTESWLIIHLDMEDGTIE